MRQFTLINNKGQTWDLGSDSSYMTEPKGLGMERKISSEKAGPFWIPTENYFKQKSIEGTIILGSYEIYLDFSKFVQHTPIKLIYRAATEATILVDVEKMEKSELQSGILQCKITFLNRGLYFITKRVESMESEGTGKTYPYTYPYTYKDVTQSTVEIESDSAVESPAILTIFGPCTNPGWYHYIDGVLKTTGKIGRTDAICSIQEGEKIVVDTSQIPWSIKKYDLLNNFLLDVYQSSDWTTDRFIMLEYGKNKISVTQESEGKLKIVLEGHIFYETV